jgi:hypothetical protein
MEDKLESKAENSSFIRVDAGASGDIAAPKRSRRLEDQGMAVFALPSRLSQRRLVFLSNAITLEEQIGWSETDVRDALQPHHLVMLPNFSGDVDSRAAESAAAFKEQFPTNETIDGIVIIGGYNTVAPRRYNAIPDDLRARVKGLTAFTSGQTDDDDYYVWNDDHYATIHNAELPDFPISRIPCWNDDDVEAPIPMTCQAFVKQALETPDDIPPGFAASYGLRATAFSYSDSVYQLHVDKLGAAPIWTSPVTFGAVSETRTFEEMRSAFLYLVLHGGENDGTVFVGNANLEPVVLNKLDPIDPNDRWFSDTIFASCCWGALISDRSGNHSTGTTLPGERHLKSSLPIKFLSLGSNGFVGFTGTHHAFSLKGEAHAHYHAEPLHHRFWDLRINDGLPPALALYRARLDYEANIPYQIPDEFVKVNGKIKSMPPARNAYSRAVELKTFWSAVCLGLGW